MALLLPEAVDVTYGPTQLVGKFILNGYEAARQLGVRLYWHEDMSALRQVNRRNLPTWYPLPAMFDPTFNLLDSDNASWIEARGAAGETVSAIGLRYYDWDRTNLVAEMRSGRLFYDDPEADARPGEAWDVWAPSAPRLRGRIFYPGTLWVRRDYRGTGLAPLMCHLSLAAGWTRWNPDYVVAFMDVAAVNKNAETQFGLRNIEDGASFLNTGLGDHQLILAWNSRYDMPAVIEDFQNHPVFTSRTTETRVATRSPSA